MQPKEVLLKWVDAFNKTDSVALEKLYHEDAVNHQVANEPVNGKPAIKRMFEDEFALVKMVCILKIFLRTASGRSWNGETPTD